MASFHFCVALSTAQDEWEGARQGVWKVSHSGLHVPPPKGRRIHRQSALGAKGRGMSTRPGSSQTWARACAARCVTLSRLPNLSEPDFSVMEAGDTIAFAGGPARHWPTPTQSVLSDAVCSVVARGWWWGPELRLGVKRQTWRQEGCCRKVLFCSSSALTQDGGLRQARFPFSSAPVLLGDSRPEPGLSGPLSSLSKWGAAAMHLGAPSELPMVILWGPLASQARRSLGHFVTSSCPGTLARSRKPLGLLPRWT